MVTKEEVVAKITRLLATKYSGDLHEMFVYYSPIGPMSASQLITVLQDAGIGGPFTHGTIAMRIIGILDTDGDGRMSEEELLEAIKENNP